MSDRAIPNQVLLDFSNRKLLSPVPKKLYESAKVYFTNKELDLLQTAYNVAFEAHKDQLRKEGSAYITHPVEVASILMELHLDIETVCAGLMHDVLEDSFIKKSYLEKLFGKDVVAIVDGVSNLNKLDFIYLTYFFLISLILWPLMQEYFDPIIFILAFSIFKSIRYFNKSNSIFLFSYYFIFLIIANIHYN